MEKRALIALCILIVGSITLAIFGPTGGLEFSVLNLGLGMILDVVMFSITVFLLQAIRGDRAVSKMTTNIALELSVWGYIWRSVLVRYLSMMVAMIFFIALQVNYKQPSEELTTAYFAVSLPVSIALVWLFFSTDKKGNIRWIVSLARGY